MEYKFNKIIITGDIATKNIPQFSTSKIAPNLRELITQADLSVYNLEGPIAPNNEFAKKTSVEFREAKLANSLYETLNYINLVVSSKIQSKFYSDERIVRLLRLNKNTLVTLANNHIKDLGKIGFSHTIKILENNNINYTGAGLSKRQMPGDYESNNVVIINSNLIGVHKFGLALHLYSARKKCFGADYIAFTDLKKRIRKYKAANKKVILILHGGRDLPANIPKTPANLGLDLALIKKLGANITVIHHAHVYIKNEYENDNIFVLGDFIFKSDDSRLPLDRPSAMLEIVISKDKLTPKLVRFKMNEAYQY